MSNGPILRDYVSDLDKFLQEFDQQHTFSKTQQQEVTKYRRVYRLRDENDTKPAIPVPSMKLWEGF